MAAPRGRPKNCKACKKHTLLTYCTHSEPKLNVKKDIIEKILYDVVCSVAETVGKAKQKTRHDGSKLKQKNIERVEGTIPVANR